MYSKISVTGGSGFVGKNLIPYLLNQGLSVKTLDRESLFDQKLDKFEDCDVFIHLAGKAHDLKKTSNPEEYYRVNFELTRDLYSSFLKSNAKKFIFISSVKASADAVNGILDENLTPNPQTDYGKSKLMAEDFIRQQPLSEGKSFFILRPCMIHGPGNKGNLNLLFKVVNMKVPYPLAGFENKRSFLSIDNLSLIIYKFIECQRVKSGVYNVSDDVPLSTNQVIEIIANTINVKFRLWRVNPKLVVLIARIGDYLGLPLNSERLKKLSESYVVSNEKVKRSLNIEELPIPSDEGLAITIKSFLFK